MTNWIDVEGIRPATRYLEVPGGRLYQVATDYSIAAVVATFGPPVFVPSASLALTDKMRVVCARAKALRMIAHSHYAPDSMYWQSAMKRLFAAVDAVSDWPMVEVTVQAMTAGPTANGDIIDETAMKTVSTDLERAKAAKEVCIIAKHLVMTVLGTSTILVAIDQQLLTLVRHLHGALLPWALLEYGEATVKMWPEAVPMFGRFK